MAVNLMGQERMAKERMAQWSFEKKEAHEWAMAQWEAWLGVAGGHRLNMMAIVGIHVGMLKDGLAFFASPSAQERLVASARSRGEEAVAAKVLQYLPEESLQAYVRPEGVPNWQPVPRRQALLDALKKAIIFWCAGLARSPSGWPPPRPPPSAATRTVLTHALQAHHQRPR